MLRALHSPVPEALRQHPFCMAGKHLHMAGAGITNGLHRAFTGGKAEQPPPSSRCSSPKQVNLPSTS